MRRCFDLLIGDFQRTLARPDGPECGQRLGRAAGNLVVFDELLAADPAKVRQLVETTFAVRGTTGAGRTVAEEKMMDCLAAVARQCGSDLEAAGVKNLASLEAVGQVPPAAQPALETLRLLCGYALDCLAYLQPRDSNGGRRRSSAFEILASAGRFVDQPEVLTLALKNLGKANSPQVYGVFRFLTDYFVSRDAEPDERVIDRLLALVKATRSRSIACGALNVLVETGVFDELSALSYMDEWKEKILRW